MNPELQNQIIEKYPSLFALKDNSREPISYGIECGDGWFDILSSLCFLIAQHERNIEGNNKYRQSKNQEPIEYEPVQFTQIKEKFGGLRIYTYGGDEYLHGLRGMAESWSYHTCERCGEKGKPNKNGWILTLCEKCKTTKAAS
jgi:hypothetical protein